jgi:hypothetical protein
MKNWKNFSIKKGKMEFEDLFSKDEKLNQTAYLEDMFGLYNELNVCLQVHNSSITDLYDKIKPFQMKLNLWISHLSEKKIYTFPVLTGHLEENETVTSLNEKLTLRNESAFAQFG